MGSSADRLDHRERPAMAATLWTASAAPLGTTTTTTKPRSTRLLALASLAVSHFLQRQRFFPSSLCSLSRLHGMACLPACFYFLSHVLPLACLSLDGLTRTFHTPLEILYAASLFLFWSADRSFRIGSNDIAILVPFPSLVVFFLVFYAWRYTGLHNAQNAYRY